MEFDPRLKEGLLIKRYKRFLADIETVDGRQLTIHCPNTGSMQGCKDPGSRVWYSTSNNTSRKYPDTWEMVETSDGELVGINTGRANALVAEAWHAGILAHLNAYSELRREVPLGEENSRIDFLLSDPGKGNLPDCYVEVKNVSLGRGDGLGVFPDAVTVRGQRHLRELIAVRSQGKRAVLLFCVQHTGVKRVAPADDIDPDYGRLLRKAAEAGVELLAFQAILSPRSISLSCQLPVQLDQESLGSSNPQV